MPEIFNPPSYTPSVLYQSAADWEGNSTVVLEIYQEGRETDTGKFKIGDGVTQWASLPYSTPDGSPFTGDAIVNLDSISASGTDVVPVVHIVEGVAATANGEALGAGTHASVATGYFDFAANPSDGDILPSINGCPDIIFSTTQNVFPYIQIGSELTTTLYNLSSSLTLNRNAPGFTALQAVQVPYSGNPTRFSVFATAPGVAGNSITLGDDTANITRSAATLLEGVDGATISIGNKIYNVVAEDVAPVGDEISGGDAADTYATNIAAKVNEDTADTLCTCVVDVDEVSLIFTANDTGADGNDITFETTDPNLDLDAGFTGGITGGNFLDKSTVNAFGQSTQGLQIITTAAGTTTLTVNSPPQTRFIGTDVQNVALPVVSTLPQIGVSYAVINDSSDVVTVNSSGANLVQDIAPGANAVFMCIALTGTDATSWRVFYNSPGSVPAVVWDDDITTTQTDVGKAFDAPLGQVGGYTIQIDDGLVYEAGACWAFNNLSDSTLIITLVNTPANLRLLDGTNTSNGALDIAPGGSAVVRLTADLTTYIATGVGLTIH